MQSNFVFMSFKQNLELLKAFILWHGFFLMRKFNHILAYGNKWIFANHKSSKLEIIMWKNGFGKQMRENEWPTKK